MTELLTALQSLVKQGGLVLWIMIGLSVFLYTILSSTWLTLLRVEGELKELVVKLKKATSVELLADEKSLFELNNLSWVRRRMPVLSVLLALAPLAGLLGTVSGMLNTFAGLACATTTKPIDGISSGISEALITTQVGLLIAIPGSFLYGFIKNKLGKLARELDQMTSQRIIELS